MNRTTRMLGAGALALGAFTAVSPIVAAPASAAGSCSETKWDTHPDLVSTGVYSWGDGSAIRTAGYTECTLLGRGYQGQGIDVHCRRTNANGLIWVYVRNTTTGVAGWARADTLYKIAGSAEPPFC